MQLLWIILRWFFPNDPVQQCIGAARHRIALMASEVFSPQSLYLLERDPQARLHIEALIIDYEAALHTATGARACQIARMRFRFHPKAFHRPTRALSVARLLARIRALVTMCSNIERLAQIRAERLKRERDADPLGLNRHEPVGCIEQREMHHRATRTGASSSLAEGGGGESRALARETEGVGRNAAGLPRGPPIFDVQPHPQPDSQPPARALVHGQRRPAIDQCSSHPASNCSAS